MDDIYYIMMIVGLIVWGICGFLIGKYSERSNWNNLIKSGAIPCPVDRPFEFEVMKAAICLAKELENPVPDLNNRNNLQAWVIESVNNLIIRRHGGI